MAYFYTAIKIGNGTSEDPYRPIFDNVYYSDHINTTDGQYLVASLNPIDGQTALTDSEIRSICNKKSLDRTAVMQWLKGGG